MRHFAFSVNKRLDEQAAATKTMAMIAMGRLADYRTKSIHCAVYRATQCASCGFQVVIRCEEGDWRTLLHLVAPRESRSHKMHFATKIGKSATLIGLSHMQSSPKR